MKRATTLWTLNVGRWTLVLLPFAVVVTPAFAFTADKDNPYATIVERNAFALKPPTPPVVATPPAPAASNVELRGITTLLGRPQVLLNFKMPGKPPEPPKDRSLVMDVGQREGEVEVLEINPATGSIRIRNQGNELAMNLKDNAPKPQFTPSLAAPGIQPPGVNPGIPAPAGVPAPAAAAGGTSVSTIGGSSSGSAAPARPGLPTRNLRSGSAGTTATGTTVANDARALPLEAQMALIEVERERTAEAVSAGKMPPLPPINLPK